MERLNGHMDAMRLQDALLVMDYVHMHGLQDRPYFEWTNTYLHDRERMEEMRRTLKAKVQRGPKFKFGVQVPNSPWQAAKLDRENGNILWRESTDKELGQINQYKTLRFFAMSTDNKMM